jgi:Tol biopolymer transport system component
LAYTRLSVDIDIWRADGHTAERDPVSSTEMEYNPQFSPDGKRIAFESDRSGPEEIWVANSDGTNPAQLANFGRHCGSPRWSPDGRRIVFDGYMVSGRWDIWVFDSSGGTPRELTKGPGNSATPSFSHDGKWVFSANDRTGRNEIFRAPFGGGAAVQVTHSGGTRPQESPDGQTVYYPKSGSWRDPVGLYETSIAGGEERPSGVSVIDQAFSGNGEWHLLHRTCR